MTKKDLKQRLRFCHINREEQGRQITLLEGEIRQWAMAQDAVRAEWLGIIAALGQIVPVIERESTLAMIGRIQDKVATLQQQLAVAHSLIQGIRMFDCRCIGPSCECLSGPARKLQEDAAAWLADHKTEPTWGETPHA